MQIVGQNPDSRPRHSSQSPIFLRRPQSKVRGEPILLSFKLGLYLIRTRSPKRNPNLLQRSEIVALFNTFNRLSESLQAIQRFRQMYHERLNSDNMVSINLSFSIFVYLTWFKLSSSNNYTTNLLANATGLFTALFTRIVAQLDYWNIPIPTYIRSVIPKNM